MVQGRLLRFFVFFEDDDRHGEIARTGGFRGSVGINGRPSVIRWGWGEGGMGAGVVNVAVFGSKRLLW